MPKSKKAKDDNAQVDSKDQPDMEFIGSTEEGSATLHCFPKETPK